MGRRNARITFNQIFLGWQILLGKTPSEKSYRKTPFQFSTDGFILSADLQNQPYELT
jgi:hypothetical protein